MTCKDCYMHDVCKDWARDCFGKDTTFPYEAEKNFCKFYKDKSRIVELPCKLGDELNDEIVHEIDFREFESQGVGTVVKVVVSAETFQCYKKLRILIGIT